MAAGGVLHRVCLGGVPLVQATGYGGTLQTSLHSPDAWKETRPVEDARPVTVHFAGNTSDSLPWKFTPSQASVRVRRLTL